MTAAVRLRLSLVLSMLWFLGLILWPRSYFEADTFLIQLFAGITAIFVVIYGAAWVMSPEKAATANGPRAPGIPQWAIVTISLLIIVAILVVPKLLIR